MSDKTHYRKVFKSDHLGVADLEEMLEVGKRLIFTIREVKQYLLEDGNRNSGVSVAGRRISANIAYFTDATIKPLVLNATNSKQVAKFAGSKYVDDWSNQLIELHIDSNVKMKSEIVGGVRIRAVQPIKEKPVLDINHKNWEGAKKAVAEKNATFESLNKNYIVSQANYDLLCG